METNSISIKNDAICRKKLWNLQQRVTSNSGSSDQVETIFTRCIRNIQDMDRPQELEESQKELSELKDYLDS